LAHRPHTYAHTQRHGLVCTPIRMHCVSQAMSGAREALALLLACVVYLPTLLSHKLGVFMMGAQLNWTLRGTGLRVSWHRLVFHDWVKFLPRAEFFPYARRWFDSNLRASVVGRAVARTPLVRWLPVRSERSEWTAAVEHHVHRMDHHLEYYTGPDLGLWRRRGVMPDEAVVEMLADKMGAQWGYDGRWPDATNWDRLAPGFDAQAWPSARNKALFFGVSCAAGFAPCFARAGVRFGWAEVEQTLGGELTGKLRALAGDPPVVLRGSQGTLG
jgi:hypothetical protein